MSDIVLFYVTCADMAEARNIAGQMVEQRLAACANILPSMTSVYQWQGKIEESNEAVLLLKTRKSLADQVMAAVKAAHSYDVPAILQLDVTATDPDWGNWLMAETARPFSGKMDPA